jgi:hypothetical protein
MVQTRSQNGGAGRLVAVADAGDAATAPSPGASTRSQRKRTRTTPPATGPSSPHASSPGVVERKRARRNAPTPKQPPQTQTMLQRLEELNIAYNRARSRKDDSYAAVVKLADAFVKDYGADCMPRMTQTDAKASWAQLSMGNREVDEASERLCKTVLTMIKLRPHAQTETRQEGKLASLAYDVLAILACGQPCTAAVNWLLDHAAELARAAARDDGCETAQFSAVVCIHNLIYFEQGAERLAKDKEAVTAATHAVLEAMSTHRGSERVQNCGLLFCRNLSSHHEGEAAMLELGLTPVLQAVVNALEKHPKSERVQCHGISCLKYLTETEECAEVVVNSTCGGPVVKTSLTAMKSHKESVSVLERAVAFLKNITWGAAQGCATVLNAGGVPCLLDAMCGHLGSEAVQEGGVSALRNLWMSAAGELALLQHNGVETVLVALKKHLKSVVVCVHAMSFFKHAADSDAGAARMLEIDVLTHLLAAVMRHPDAVEIQSRGLTCLFHLAFDEPGLEAVGAHAKAVVDWAVPLAIGPKTELHREAAKLLDRLAACVPGRLEILRHDGTASMLQQALAMPPHHGSNESDSDSSGDEGEDTPSPKSPLLGLADALVPCCDDEAVLRILRRSTSNSQSAMLAMSCAHLKLSEVQAHKLFVAAGGLKHLFSKAAMSSADSGRRGLAACAVRSVLRTAHIRSPTQALPPPLPLPSHPAHDFSRFIDNPSGADVVFVVGAKRWYGHRVVLAASTSSDVFAAMFERSGAQMKEAAARRAVVDAAATAGASSRPRKRARHRSSSSSEDAVASSRGGQGQGQWSTAPLVEIVLDDLEPEIFGYVLRELYGVPQTDIPNEHIVGVLLAANRFLLETLRMTCVRQLVEGMDRSTVMQLFSEVVPMVGGGSAAAALEDACACFLIDELALTAPAQPVLLPKPPPTRSERRAAATAAGVSAAAAAAPASASAAAASAEASAVADEAQAIVDRHSWEELVHAEAERVNAAETSARSTVVWLAAQLGGAVDASASASGGNSDTTSLQQQQQQQQQQEAQSVAISLGGPVDAGLDDDADGADSPTVSTTVPGASARLWRSDGTEPQLPMEQLMEMVEGLQRSVGRILKARLRSLADALEID